MRKLISLLSIFLTLLTACSKKTTQTETVNPDIQKKVNVILDSLWIQYVNNNNLTHGGVAVYATFPNGSIFAKSNLSDNINRNSLFRGASNTKLFTASGIMLLQERNLLNINDKITDNIPGTTVPYVSEQQEYNIPYKQQITIRQLLEHRAGVFDLTNFAIPDTCNAPYAGQNYIYYIENIAPNHDFSVEEIININVIHNLYSFAPDTDYSYSNTGYMLLGKIIERVSGESLADFFENNLLKPNYLNMTNFPLSTEHLMPENELIGKVLYNGQYIDCRFQNLSYEFAQGNIITSLENLNTWISKLQKGQAGISPAVVNQMRFGSGLNNGYGFGTQWSELLGFGHTGAIAGYLSYMFYDPVDDISITLVCNLWNMNSEASFPEQVSLISEIFLRTKSICIEKNINKKNILLPFIDLKGILNRF